MLKICGGLLKNFSKKINTFEIKSLLKQKSIV